MTRSRCTASRVTGPRRAGRSARSIRCSRSSSHRAFAGPT
jgi:hypothetical protein